MNGLDFIGSVVDEMFLAPGRVIAYFQSRRKTDWQAYARETAFYHEQGYVNNPSTFFVLPPQAPDYVVETETPYQTGFYQVLSFPSLYEPANPFVRKRYLGNVENRTGYLIRWTHGDKPRKTVLCVHGFMMGAPREAERMFKIHKLFAMGLDVALFIQPFHWKRVSGPRAARRVYLTLGDAAFTNECVAHSIYDLHNAFLILKKLGAPEIGIVGASLGGYISGIYACMNREPKFAALMVPAFTFLKPISPDMFFSRAPFDPAWREQVYRAADFHSPLNLQPKIPRDKILVVASRGDKLCPADLVEQLRLRWELTRCHYRTGGHWLVFDKIRGRVWYNLLEETGFIGGQS
jgi:pimeloyl-ACP methyl ester carboxylesterase